MHDPIKIRIVAYDLLGIAGQWLDRYADQNHMELCEIISNSDESGIDITELPYYEGWDYLLVFERDTKKSPSSNRIKPKPFSCAWNTPLRSSVFLFLLLPKIYP